MSNSNNNGMQIRIYWSSSITYKGIKNAVIEMETKITIAIILKAFEAHISAQEILFYDRSVCVCDKQTEPALWNSFEDIFC